MKYMLQMESEVETHVKTARQHLYVVCVRVSRWTTGKVLHCLHV